MKLNGILYSLLLTALLASCSYEQQTRIELVGCDASYNLGTIDVGSSSPSRGKEWLIQNVGHAALVIDSVHLSCDCVEVEYNAAKAVGRNEYLPLRAFVEPDGTVGDFYREILVYGNFEGSPLVLTLEGTYTGTVSEDEQAW